MKTKNIGLGIKSPKSTCKSEKCPFHGRTKIRGRHFTGTVIAARMQKTCTVEWTRKVTLPKYERYTKKRTKVKAHNPDCIKAEEGDMVNLIECTPLSKTVNFVIVEKLGKEKGFARKMEALEESKKVKAESSAKEEQTQT